MRIHAISDLHVDYTDNLEWLQGLSDVEYREDLLIVAGDVSDDITLLFDTLTMLQAKFGQVCFVPGNHDLWVRNCEFDCSLEKFEAILSRCRRQGVVVDILRAGKLSIVPLQGWYDYSFAAPGRYLRRAWRDYRACSWPVHLADNAAVTRHFLALNRERLGESNEVVISYSHFLPRIDLMPSRIPPRRRRVYPVLGSHSLGRQVKQLNPTLHVYGHSHVNRSIQLDGIHYINNAFGYPSEEHISRKRLTCIYPQAQSIGTIPESSQ